MPKMYLDDEERKAKRERVEALVKLFYGDLAKALGPDYKLPIPKGDFFARMSSEAILIGDSYGVSIDAKPRTTNSYRPYCVGTFDVTVGGYGGKRFPARKAGPPIDMIAEHIKYEIKRRKEDALRTIVIADQVANMESQILGVHKALGIKGDKYSFSLPRLSCNRSGTAVKLDLPELSLENAKILLDLALKLGVGK